MKAGDKIKLMSLDKIKEIFPWDEGLSGIHVNGYFINKKMFHIFGNTNIIYRVYDDDNYDGYDFEIYENDYDFGWSFCKEWIEDKTIIDVDELFEGIDI